MSLRLGFVGLGNIGTPVCRNLLSTGFPLTVWDIRDEPVRRLAAAGAAAAGSLAELAAASDVVLLSLPGPPEVEAVVAGASGLRASARPGTTVLDLSSVDPNTSQRLAAACGEREIAYIDTPVLGGVPGAEAGQLTLIIGASEAELAPCRPVLETIGSVFHFTGRRGWGATLKLATNLIVLSSYVTISEAIILAAKAGIPLQTFHDVVLSSPRVSNPLAIKYAKMVRRDESPGFSIDLGQKDLELLSRLCRESRLPNFISGQAQQIYRLAQARGMGDRDVWSVLSLLEQITDTPVRRDPPPEG